MAHHEDLQAGICGENSWWSIDSTRSLFPALTSSSSPCSVAPNDVANCSTWQTDFMDLKPQSRSCGVATNQNSSNNNNNNNNFVSDHSYHHQLGFHDAQKPHKNEESESGSGSILIDSTLQMMGYGLSSSTSANWDHHSLFRCNERPDSNFNSAVEQQQTDIDSSSNSQILKDWITTPKNNNLSSSSSSSSQISTLNIFKPMNQEFSNLSSGLPIGSDSYMLVQNLYEPDPPHQPRPQSQHSLFTNLSSMSYSSTANYGASSSNIELSPIWSKVSSTFLKPSSSSYSSSSSSSSPMAVKQQQPPPIGLHFSNNTPFWNASAEALHDMRAGVFASSPSQYKTPTFQDKPNCPSILLNKLKSEELCDMESAKKNVCEGASLKRPRIETPSPLPTFKVRKEKLGDRVTALQQLVSPFGKTDTASVLHEAIEYIKFLHDQVSVLITPYMKSGAPIIQRQQGFDDETKESSEGAKQDLRSRGLCLVPISSTFPVATETTADFWTPSSLSLGGALLR